jgi:hypothetical protein
MHTQLRIARLACLPLLVAGLVTACGPRPASNPPAATDTVPMEAPTATFREFGDHTLYFNAIRTDRLTPEVATSYGIARSANRALLNISLVKKAEGTSGVPVAGQVEARAVNLNGQLKDLKVREVREGEAIYYIGDVAVGNEETLVFTVDATPADGGSRMSVRFQRQFVGN